MNPFKYTLPNGVEVTSIVMDQTEFDELCNDLEKCDLTPDKAKLKEKVDEIRKAKHLPMVGYGTKTASIFTKYKVNTEIFCACVRGFAYSETGQKVIEDAMDKVARTPQGNQVVQNMLNNIYDKLTEEEKKSIDEQVAAIVEVLKKGESPEKLIVAFIGKHFTSAGRRLRLEFIEQMLRSMSETLANRIQQMDDPLAGVDAYVRRLLVNVIIMEKAVKEKDK